MERRYKIAEGGAFSGAGKRAAFAMFYGPLHYLLVRHIISAVPGPAKDVSRVIDLGCGTGAAGAAWACSAVTPCPVTGLDRHPWAVAEAGRTYRDFGLRGRARRADITRTGLPRSPRSPAATICAFALNELPDAERDRLLGWLVERARPGDRLLIVEPLAEFVARWWGKWRARFEAAGGRADEWRVELELPPIVAKLDRAAGLDHRELTARTLWLSRC